MSADAGIDRRPTPDTEDTAMSTPEEQTAAMIANLPTTTGRSLAGWAEVIGASGLTRHSEIVSMLKQDHGITHGYANLIAQTYATAGAAPDGDALIEAQYAGPKAPLRPILERILAEVATFGSDVDVAPKKASVSLRRSRQFALVEPTTATRIDLGINLKGEPASGRLEVAGGMCTHRIRLTGVDEVDGEVVGWLRQAYERA
jgi:hypothetical protein